MKRLLFVFTVLLLTGTTEVYSQGWLEKVAKKTAKRVEERSKKKVEDKVNEAADKTVDKAFGKAEDAVTGKGNNGGNDTGGNDGEAATESTVGGNEKMIPKSLEMTYAKSDFVPGDEIIFEDDLVNEQMGEFPSQWDLLQGNAEVASINGVKCINLEAGATTTLVPLMKDMKNYLPDVFTIEFDYWVNNYTETHKIPSQNYTLGLYDKNGRKVMGLQFAEGNVYWSYTSASGDGRYGNVAQKEKIDSWSHMAISFNKRAFKAYINGVRVANVPSMAVPASMKIYNTSWRDHRTLITNIRIAKGAVPLYDRMMSDGKFITYGITFDVGKSVIKPESMGEINRIIKLMTENPDLKFSVEGHTDSTGNAANNQTLSEARSKAIVDKLVEMGIAADRLASAGKGQANPIADNATDEGRAKNRRVEFVKI